MKLTISALGSDAPNTSNLKVQLNPPDETLSMWSYGTQPPNLDGQKVMTLVRDFDDPEYGPAWFFQVPYSKVVVLQEHVFEGLIVKAVDEDGEKFEYPLKKRTGTTRGTQKRDPHDRRRKGVANPGDKPWFCYWRGTLLEGFLYPNTTSDAGDEAIDAALNAAKSDTTTTLQLPMSIHYYEEGEAATVLPRSSVTPSLITNTASSSSPVTTTKMALPQDDITRPQYPRVVKLEERRLPRKQGYQAPYCVQMLIGEDGVSKTEIANDMGEPRMFEVSERFGETVLSRRAWDEDEAVEEAEWERRTRYGRFASSETEEGEDGLAKRDLPIECHCIWMVE